LGKYDRLHGDGISTVWLGDWLRSRPRNRQYGAIFSAPKNILEKVLNDSEPARPIEVDGMTPHQGEVICRPSLAHDSN
jgi:hypothetical protein